MASRQYFHDALVFLALWVDAIGDGRHELAQWQRMAQQTTHGGSGPAQGSGGRGGGGGGPTPDEPTTGGRNRRRRGGRGKRQNDEPQAEPAPETGPEAHADRT